MGTTLTLKKPRDVREDDKKGRQKSTDCPRRGSAFIRNVVSSNGPSIEGNGISRLYRDVKMRLVRVCATWKV